jgi:hypothetical protein
MWRNCTAFLACLAASGAAGCVVDGSDSSAIRLRWDLSYLTGTQASCDGADTPSVGIVALDPRTGSRFSNMFPCHDKVAVTGKLPTGFYDVTLSLLDRKGRVVSEVLYQSVETRRSGVTEPTDVAVFPVQAWDLAWVVQRVGPGGRPVASTCEAVGAATVEMTWQLGGEPAEAVGFPCPGSPPGSYAGITPAIRTGLYQAQIRLLDAGGRSLSETGFMSQRVTMDAPATIDVELPVL